MAGRFRKAGWTKRTQMARAGAGVETAGGQEECLLEETLTMTRMHLASVLAVPATTGLDMRVLVAIQTGTQRTMEDVARAVEGPARMRKIVGTTAGAAAVIVEVQHDAESAADKVAELLKEFFAIATTLQKLEEPSAAITVVTAGLGLQNLIAVLCEDAMRALPFGHEVVRRVSRSSASRSLPARACVSRCKHGHGLRVANHV